MCHTADDCSVEKAARQGAKFVCKVSTLQCQAMPPSIGAQRLAAASINHYYAPTIDVTGEHRHSTACNLLRLLHGREPTVESSQMHDEHCVLTRNDDAVSAKLSTVLSVSQLVHFVVIMRSLAGSFVCQDAG